MITYQILINNTPQGTIQAHSRIEATQKAQVFKTESMQRIHVQKPDFGAAI